MLVIKIELHSAVTRKVTTIGQMIIANTGGTKDRGEYTAKVAHKNDVNNLGANFNRPLREGTVINYPRLSYNVWRLVVRALLSAFPEENKQSRSVSNG